VVEKFKKVCFWRLWASITKTYDRTRKANSIWSPTWAKFCRFVARLFVIRIESQIEVYLWLYFKFMRKNYLKFGFKCKK